jgi:hypothetical protein
MTDESTNGKYATASSRWAGVGPYYAMFPIKFAVSVVREHTKPGDAILDPFAGRATSLFAAASEGRIGVGAEINPVGWVYGKAKLQTGNRDSVERRLHWLARCAPQYSDEARKLPRFFHACYCREVRQFLVAARRLLKWRRRKTDWTTMALLLVELHGKRENALSNQMRQTKAMSPQYAVDWWSEREMEAPQVDPLEFMLRKLEWRYAKGRPRIDGSRIYLGDSRHCLRLAMARLNSHKAKLLLTSPPYYGVTNYFYDQWLRLWLLGHEPKPKSQGVDCRRKFENKHDYIDMLQTVFDKARHGLARNCVIVVRTDTRKFTYDATLEAIQRAFPKKPLRSETYTRPDSTQTELFDPRIEIKNEVDLTFC